MFDPLFAPIFLLAIAVPIGVIVFWAARRYLRLSSALWMTFAVPIASIAGFYLCMISNRALDPVHFLDEPPMARLGISLVSGLVTAGLCGCLVWYLSKKSDWKRVPRNADKGA